MVLGTYSYVGHLLCKLKYILVDIELEAAYDVFKNKQGKILTTDLPLISSSLGISLSETESEQVIKDAMGN